MSYRCQVCRNAVQKGEPQKRYTVYRPGGKTIEREVPVCSSCLSDLTDGGYSLDELVRLYNPAMPAINRPRLFGDRLA